MFSVTITPDMSLIINPGSESDRQSIQLSTKKNTFIKNERRRGRANQSMEAAREIHSREHLSLKIRSLSSEYNCMGLTFASRRTWIDTDQLELILNEDGYRKVDENDAMPGDLLLYLKGNDFTHIAIIIEHEYDPRESNFMTRVVSQWGADGEYLHKAHDVPDSFGKPKEIWSERIKSS
jgi:hypothetical protein